MRQSWLVTVPVRVGGLVSWDDPFVQSTGLGQLIQSPQDYRVNPVKTVSQLTPKRMTIPTTTQITTPHLLPSVLGGSGAGLGSGTSDSLGGGCVWIGAGRAGGGVYLKVLRLFITWFPTNVLRPNARQSTTVMVSGGWRCSFSGNS